jgi:hypothetical protein
VGNHYVPAIVKDVLDRALVVRTWGVGGEEVATKGVVTFGEKRIADGSAVLAGN